MAQPHVVSSSRWLFALLAVAGLGAPAPAALPLQPALQLTLLDGARFDLADLRGRIVVVNFWATWCTPCRAEMPLLDGFAQSNPAVVVIGVSMDQRRDLGDVRRAMAGLHYRAGLASTARVNGFGEPRELPVTYLLDRQGHIAARFAGGKPRLTAAALADARALCDKKESHNALDSLFSRDFKRKTGAHFFASRSIAAAP